MSYTFFFKLLSYMSSATVLLPIVAGFNKRVFLTRPFAIIFYLLLVSFLIEFACTILSLKRMSNMWLYHIYTVLEFTFLTYFYARLAGKKIGRSLLLVVYLIFLFIAYKEWRGINSSELDNVSTAFESILIFVYALATYGQMMQQLEHTNLLSTPLFWVNTGIFSYFAVCFFLFIFSNYILRDSTRLHLEMWGIHSIINIAFYSLLTVGFWKTSTT